MKAINIGIDTGNRCIKTASHTFIAGLTSYGAVKPALANEVLKYNGNYYAITSQRGTYHLDKTESEDYFVLSLFAIEKELEHRNISLDPECDSIPVILGLGLPPGHISAFKKNFIAYYKRGEVEYEYNDIRRKINIVDVEVFAQGFSAIYGDFAKIKSFRSAIIIDIGGYTTDLIKLSYGKLDPSICSSLDYGMVHLFNRTQVALRQKDPSMVPDEELIDDVLRGQANIGANIKSIIERETAAYVNELVCKLNELHINLNFEKGVFIGGGAMALKQYIEQAQDKIASPYFITDINANAKGYECFLHSTTK